MSNRDVFISHSSRDADAARALRAVLESVGYSCWMAPDDVTSTDPWASQILAAIDGCKAMVVIVSGRSIASTHVAREVELAHGRKRLVLPIRVEDVRPSGPLEYHLTGLQRIDAFPPPIFSHRDAILGRITAAVPMRTTETPIPVSSPEPTPPLPAAVVGTGPRPVDRESPPPRQSAGFSAWARANSMLAGVAVTLAALFVVGAVAMALGGPGGAKPTTGPTAAPASVTAAGSPTAPPSTSSASLQPVPSRSRPALAPDGAFPNATEVDLFMALPHFGARAIEDCTRTAGELVGALARIDCFARNGEHVFYRQWADVAAVRTDYRTNLRVNMDNAEGSCATGPVGDGEWLRDGQVAGRLACQLWDGGPSVTFAFTDEARRIMAVWYGSGNTVPEDDRALGYALFLAWTAE
ncbi:MAG: TIR domain-containing protein [Candidatus Limnocylindrales bacterium]